MSKTFEILLAGFGGQGILFAGKSITYAGMKNDYQVSWIPSYGPEMRGGTCNCSVVVSENLIGCPIVSDPSILVAMNLPSLDKFESAVVSGGTILVDSTLIARATTRSDVKFISIPATQLATDNGFPKLANMILVGKLLKETGFVTYDQFKESMIASIPASKQKMLDQNLKAIDLGFFYEA